MEPVRFLSADEHENKRHLKRLAQAAVLSKAEANHYRRKDKEERKKHENWMLPSVNSRLQVDDGEHSDRSSRKKSKKQKKKKHEMTGQEDSSSSQSDTDNSKTDDCEWIEKGSASTKSQDVKLERDSWMTVSDIFAPTLSRAKMRRRDQSLKPADDDTNKKLTLDKPGQHTRELNPYWKDGGSGLPKKMFAEPSSSLSSSSSNATKSVGDGGLKWLRQAYRRCVEQAEDEGRSLEEVASERWGSLDNLQNLIDEASQKCSDSPQGRGRLTHQEPRTKHGDYERDRHWTSSKEHHSETEGRSRASTSQSGPQHLLNYESRLSMISREQPPTIRGTKPKFIAPTNDDSDDITRTRQSTSLNKKPRWRKEEYKKEATSVGSKTFPEKKPTDETPTKKDVLQPSTLSPIRENKESVIRDSSPVRNLSEKEMNELAAKLVKAELLGNFELASKLKSKLETAKASKTSTEESANPSSAKNATEHVVLMSSNQGLARPLAEPTTSSSKSFRKKQKVQTHDGSGQRTKYFADDDKYSLKQMFEREKLSTAEDQNAMFSRLAGRGVEKTTEDYDVDDMFVSRANTKVNEVKMDAQERLRAINDYKRSSEAIEQCRYCFDGRNMLKHMIVAIGMNVYLSLPPVQSLVDGHCLIVPVKHVTGATYVDEEVWDEIQIFRKGLCKMFEELNFDVIFFELCMDAKRFPHMTIHCIPLPKDVGNLAPMYFKKAIMESETEWAHNKKLVDLSSKNVRRAIPKGLPYFCVNFGLNDGGFGHVIEDERLFPRNFAQEIIGGMLDLDAHTWRRPPRESFDDQRKKVLKFAEWWKPYDWTQRLKNQN